jgi:hypothetical protein
MRTLDQPAENGFCMGSAGIAQLVEQLICNSRQSFCACFHSVAQHRGREVIHQVSICAALRRIALLYRRKGFMP